MTAAATVPARHDDELTHRQIVTILIGLMMGMFLAALDQNIVGTAIKTIADDLDGYSAQAWVTTAYLITSTISTPIYGKLSDLYGRKPFFLAAIVIFVLGSLACTFSTSMYMLAAFRAIQGLGAGGLMSLALAIVGDIVPPRERAKYQGYFLAVFGTSSVLGPIIGGFFAGTDSFLGVAGWRWVFLVNVPVGIAAMIVVTSTLHLHHVRRKARIDWWGALMLVVALVPLLLVAEQGREWGWGSGRSWACFLIGAAGVIAFVVVERFVGDDALIPLRIFRNRTIVTGLLGGFVVGMGMFGGMMVIPQYLQIVHGASPTDSGFMMLPMVAGIMSASVVSGQLMSRTGRVKVFPLIGVTLMVAGLLLLHTASADTELWVFMVYMFVLGLGMGNTMQPLTLAVQAAVPPRDIGMATSSATFFRQIGGTLGVAVFLSLLLGRLPDNMSTALQDATRDPAFIAATRDRAVLAQPDDAHFVQALASHDPNAFAGIMNDTSVLNRLADVFSHPFKVGFSESMDTVFLVGAIVCATGVVVLAFMPDVTLSNRSARAQAGADAAAAQSAAQGSGQGASEASSATAATDEEEYSRPHTATDHLVDAAAAECGGHTIDEIRWTSAAVDPVEDGEPAPGRGRSLYGRVALAGRTPVADAILTLVDDGRQAGRTVTDAFGRYRLDVGAPGTYVLLTAAPDIEPQAGLVTVGDAALRHDVTLAGRAAVTGRVVTARGGETVPVGGGRVTVTDEAGQVVGSSPVADDGSFSVTGLLPGRYVLVALPGTSGPSGHGRPVCRTARVAQDEVVAVDLPVAPGGRVEAVVSTARHGGPVEGAAVVLVDETGEIVAAAVTDAAGRHTFDDVPPGRYTLTASGHAPRASAVTVVADEVTFERLQLGDAAAPEPVADVRPAGYTEHVERFDEADHLGHRDHGPAAHAGATAYREDRPQG